MLDFFKLGKNDRENNVEKEESSPIVAEITNRLNTISPTTAKEIMVPRIDVVSLSLNSSVEEIIATIQEKKHSRIPVWEKTIDDIIGILYAKDLFDYFFSSNIKIDLKKLLREPYFIPESKKILSLLKEFQLKKNHLAVVVDEYGGVSGIVTLEDILEEIVGEIQDEFDEEEDLVNMISENVYIIDSRAYIEDINERLNLKLPTDKSDTIGGFLFDMLGKIPEQDEIIDYHNIEFKVTSIEGNKINKITLTINTILQNNMPQNEN